MNVEGSTRLWEQYPDGMRAALARHDELVEGAVAAHNGQVVRPRSEGDSRFAVFRLASDAVTAATAIRCALHAEPWPSSPALRVRIGLHTGEVQLRAADYYGSAVNRCARLRGIAHAGHTLMSGTTAALVRDHLPRTMSLRGLGTHQLRDLSSRRSPPSEP